MDERIGCISDARRSKLMKLTGKSRKLSPDSIISLDEKCEVSDRFKLINDTEESITGADDLPVFQEVPK